MREVERGKEEGTAKAEKNEEGKGEQTKREAEKEENKTGTVKRRCEGFVSVEAFEIFSQGRDLESCDDLSWEDPLEKHKDLSNCELVSCELMRVVLCVVDVPVSPSSVVTELYEVSPCCSDWEFVYAKPPSFFSPKIVHFVVEVRLRR